MATEQTLIAGQKYAPENLGNVLVLGLGVTGRSCAAYLFDLLDSRVETLTVITGEPNSADEKWAQDVSSYGVQVLFNCQTVDENMHFDLCIVSPGISQFSDFYQSATRASAELISEVEFAWRESSSDSRWVAITGTNGKTTTTALCACLLRTAGMDASAVGNIGAACIEEVASAAPDIYVAETSSYQLASTSRFAPNAAVVLNITPDHLSWHKTHENYALAKWKVLDNLSDVSNALAVLDATNDEVRAKIREIKAIPKQERGYDYIPIGTAQGIGFDMRQACGSDNAAFVGEDGTMHVAFCGEQFDLANINDLNIKGAHNISNALAAACVALWFGADTDSINKGLTSFEALEHRMEFVGEINGVACYNDSKATNVDAVLAALESFDTTKPIVLLGGRDKGTDLSLLIDGCKQHAQAVVCFGESAERFLKAFGDACSCDGNNADLTDEMPEHSELSLLRAEHLEDALDAALDISKAGDVILLSPACASFDEFSCFEERGDVFKSFVRARG